MWMTKLSLYYQDCLLVILATVSREGMGQRNSQMLLLPRFKWRLQVTLEMETLKAGE